MTSKRNARKTSTSRKPTAFQAITKNLGQLDRPELEELADMVAALLEDLTEDEETDDQVDDDGGSAKASKQAARGHVEAKTINGCGPYLYLRYWSGKTLKSKYIGKAKK